MLNHGKNCTGTVINHINGKITIYPESLMTGIIRVYHNTLGILWQKKNCEAKDISVALLILENELREGLLSIFNNCHIQSFNFGYIAGVRNHKDLLPEDNHYEFWMEIKG